MSAKRPNWKAIARDFRSGIPIGEIAKRYGVSLLALIKRIHAEAWKRGKASNSAGAKSKGTGANAMNLPIISDAKIAEIVDQAVEQAVSGVVADHKRITRGLRNRLAAEMAEFEESCRYLATFRDEEHIIKLANLDDDGKALREYLNQCNAHHKARAETLERLSRIGSQVISLEQGVWGLDGPKTHQPESYDDLLENLNLPLRPNAISDNVLNFEQRLKEMGKAL